MNCEEALVLLSGYLDQTNTEEEMAQLREHLAVCPDCNQVLHTLEEINIGVAALEAEPPADLRTSVMDAIRVEAKPRRKPRRWMPVAVAAALVLMIGVSTMRQDNAAAPMAATADLAAPAMYARTMDAAATVSEYDSQALADRLLADVVVTGELLPEMEVCPCETLEDGTLLYRLADANAAAELSRKYGLELYTPAETAAEVSYARLQS